MKKYFRLAHLSPNFLVLFLVLFQILASFSRLSAQDKTNIPAKDTLDPLTGLYHMTIDTTQAFRIKKEKDQLILEVAGQGQTELLPLGTDQFRPKVVAPPATLTFIRDSLKEVNRFTWYQDHTGQQTKFIRKNPVNKQDRLSHSAGWAGLYKMTQSPYRSITIEDEEGRLSAQIDAGAKMELSLLSGDELVFKKDGYTIWFVFKRDKQGLIRQLITRESGLVNFTRVRETGEKESSPDFRAKRQQFTYADSLRGMLTSLRTCYDVLYYGLDIKVMPETKSIQGSVTIRFRAVASFDKLQVDLYANMAIEKIVFHDRLLPFTRQYNAIFIQFPGLVETGKEESITITYSGKPQTPDITTLKGGFIWFYDRNGNPWIESVCQGSGASLWWPCKDHLSDKPDSMDISITVPPGLTDISNGRLRKVTRLADSSTRFDWHVSYPINNYNVVVNIGKYAHLTDLYSRGKNDTLTLDYYCMPYNLDKAKKIYARVKPLLSLYEQDFGNYPFERDGFTLMESLYPMEHQGAVSIGPVNNPVNSNKTDLQDLIRTAWHETAHEWWGNSVTCKDMADFWIHEAFATYGEVLAYERLSGKAAAMAYLGNQHPENTEPIIGTYNVNDFHLGDMYPKGCLMLHTLRSILDKDTLWFGVLRGIQDSFRYKTVTTEDITGYINQATRKDFTAFFDQYLRHGAIPELSINLKQEDGILVVRYKWIVDVPGFNMRIKATTVKNEWAFIYPTTDWQTISLPGMQEEDFKVDTDNFYIKVKKE
ncbi:M1 family metallopeptidase [Flavitalea flava]